MFGIEVPEDFRIVDAWENENLCYAAFTESGAYNRIAGDEVIPQGLVLVGFLGKEVSPTLASANTLLENETLQKVLGEGALHLGPRNTIRLGRHELAVVEAAYKETKGIAGVFERGGKHMVFLMWPAKGYSLKPERFNWVVWSSSVVHTGSS